MVVEKLDKEIERLKRYLNSPIELSIRGALEEEQAPLFRKRFFQIAPCSEGTHLKFYFDAKTFVAVPIDCRMNWNDEQFIAYDKDKQLEYRFNFSIGS